MMLNCPRFERPREKAICNGIETLSNQELIAVILRIFIMHEDGEFLDGQYAAFGKVLEGMDVVDKIAAVKTDGNDRPMTEQKIATIRVDTKGEEYPEPDKLRDPYGRF